MSARLHTAAGRLARYHEAFGAWFSGVEDEYAKIGVHGLDKQDMGQPYGHGWQLPFIDGLTPQEAVRAHLHDLPLRRSEAA